MDFNMLTRFSREPRIVTWSFERRLADADVNSFGSVSHFSLGVAGGRVG